MRSTFLTSELEVPTTAGAAAARGVDAKVPAMGNAVAAAAPTLVRKFLRELRIASQSYALRPGCATGEGRLYALRSGQAPYEEPPVQGSGNRHG